MAPSLVLSTSSQPQLHLCRPLLSIPKSRLLSTCHRFDLHHLIDDPSNRNPAFERIRIRDVLGAMQREEEGRKVLAQLAEVQSVVKRAGAGRQAEGEQRLQAVDAGRAAAGCVGH